jgi:myo-inositol 2-dehydrogenase/D-chiro-inositol 1-dehydrogenase
VRFGLIGYGLWGRHHARAIQATPGATLSAIACRSEATASAARADLPGVAVHLGYQELLARDDVDVVAVVVPNDLHAEVATAALAHGKDVLLEKPLAPTLEACDRLIETARRSGRVLTVGHELRLSTQWGRIKALIEAGEIGEPMAVVMNLFRFPYRRGSEGWRYDPARIGSWIMEELVHHFDLALWYFEAAGRPTSVVAAGNGRHGVSAMTENFAGLLRFPGDRYAVVSQTLAGFDYDLVVEVTGSDGAIRATWVGALDRTRQAAFELAISRRGAGAPQPIPIAPSGELYELEEQFRRLVRALGERRPLVSAEEARRPVAVCLAAERSLRERREIPLTWEA